MLAICVWLCSCLCIACSKCFRRSHACHMCSLLFLPVQSLLMHVFQKFSYPLCRLCLSLSSLNLPQTVRLFNILLHSQAPQQQYTVQSFSSTRRHGHSHKLTFHVHYGITPTAKTPGNHTSGCLSCISVTKECMLPNRFT